MEVRCTNVVVAKFELRCTEMGFAKTPSLAACKAYIE